MIKSISAPNSLSIKAKLVDYNQLLKMRLTFTVVLSAVLGYLIAFHGFELHAVLALTIGGFLVVGSANGINQIIEKDFDSKMLRTNERPLATNRMSIFEASIFCTLLGITGIYILGTYLNQLSAILGFASLVSYAFIYTPLKRYSSFAVFVGAFPGAIPPLLGWVAARGTIDMGGITLFALQFIWQFPHFWAIAWILDEDYKRAGYNLLPSRDGRNKKSALLTVLYTLALVPISAVPFVIGVSGSISLFIAIVCGILLSLQALKLYRTCETKDAKRLMFYSIIYNPIVLLAYFIDKL
jgi:protoheme IX farnesyltransferase